MVRQWWQRVRHHSPPLRGRVSLSAHPLKRNTTWSNTGNPEPPSPFNAGDMPRAGKDGRVPGGRGLDLSALRLCTPLHGSAEHSGAQRVSA